MKSASQRHKNSAEYARIYLSCIQQFDEACRSVFKGHRFHRLCEEKKVLGRKKIRFPIFKATERNVASRIVLNPSGYRASGPPSSSGLYLNLQSDVSLLTPCNLYFALQNATRFLLSQKQRWFLSPNPHTPWVLCRFLSFSWNRRASSGWCDSGKMEKKNEIDALFKDRLIGKQQSITFC